jgi:PTH2 family peptidyl-tRNA hydrolase
MKVLCLNWLVGSNMKQVMVVRTDLKMGKGKIASQVAHASLTSALQVKRLKPEWFDEWISKGQEKVVLKVNNEDELLEILNKARSKGLIAVEVRDRGYTQVPAGSLTCVGIGPAPEDLIDEVTGKLKLL